MTIKNCDGLNRHRKPCVRFCNEKGGVTPVRNLNATWAALWAAQNFNPFSAFRKPRHLWGSPQSRLALWGEGGSTARVSLRPTDGSEGCKVASDVGQAERLAVRHAANFAVCGENAGRSPAAWPLPLRRRQVRTLRNAQRERAFLSYAPLRLLSNRNPLCWAFGL